MAKPKGKGLPRVKSGGNLDDGYIGTTTRNPEIRFEEHKKGALKDKIRETTRMETLATNLTKTQAYELERELRPEPDMGWNGRIGGGGIPDGKPINLYHIYDNPELERNPPKPGLTKRFVKWIFRMGK